MPKRVDKLKMLYWIYLSNYFFFYINCIMGKTRKVRGGRRRKSRRGGRMRTRASLKRARMSYRRRRKTSQCRGKGPAVCRSKPGCKYASGRKRSYCRKSKATRRRR